MAKKTAYLLTYVTTFVLMGIPIYSIGGLIPFIAEELGIEQTQYSIIFSLSSISSLAAVFIYKIFEAKRLLPSHHIVAIICLLGMAFFSAIMVYMRTLFLQCLTFAVMNMFIFILIVTLNICLLVTPQKEDVGLWVSFSNGFYGIGGLLGPILVGMLRQDIVILIAVASLALAPFYYFLESPELKNQQSDQQKTEEVKLQGSKRLQKMISFGFFIIAGIQVSIQSWIPTYAVLTAIKTKQEAVQFTSIFWAMSTACRFVFGCLKYPGSLKLSVLITAQVVTGVVCSLLGLCNFPSFAAYFCSIFYGASMSLIFPLFLSVSKEFNIHFSDSQVSNMLIQLTLGGGGGRRPDCGVDEFQPEYALLQRPCLWRDLVQDWEDDVRDAQKGIGLRPREKR